MVRNTNTAMGKALAQAMGNVTLESTPAPVRETKEVTGLAGKVKDKKKLADELGIGEITLTDILNELEKPA